MKKFIPLEQVVNKSKRVVTWFDKLSFLRIFLMWASAIVVIGFVYHFFATDSSFLYLNPAKERVASLLDSIYFSFVTATTTGFGDVIPIGSFKLIAIMEVVFGLLLLAFVTSKLVSIKQDIILSELYEISFNDRIYNLRSSLMVFRQNLTRTISKIEDSAIKKRELSEIYVYFSSFEDSLNQTSELIETQKRSFKKVVDTLNAEVIFNSIVQSFEKINEFVAEANKSKIEWKRDITIGLINKCMEQSDRLFAKVKTTKILQEKLISDLTTQKNELYEKIRAGLK